MSYSYTTSKTNLFFAIFLFLLLDILLIKPTPDNYDAFTSLKMMQLHH